MKTGWLLKKAVVHPPNKENPLRHEAISLSVEDFYTDVFPFHMTHENVKWEGNGVIVRGEILDVDGDKVKFKPFHHPRTSPRTITVHLKNIRIEE